MVMRPSACSGYQWESCSNTRLEKDAVHALYLSRMPMNGCCYGKHARERPVLRLPASHEWILGQPNEKPYTPKAACVQPDKVDGARAGRLGPKCFAWP